MCPPIVITREDPTSSVLCELVTELDDYLAALYPPESRHGLDLIGLQDKAVTIFVAWLGDMPVGCGAIKVLAGGCAEIKRMYVRPIARGQGIGQQILKTIELFAKRTHIHTLRLETGVYQLEAIRLYEKFGFDSIPPFDPYQPDPLCLFFEKRLLK